MAKIDLEKDLMRQALEREEGRLSERFSAWVTVWLLVPQKQGAQKDKHL